MARRLIPFAALLVLAAVTTTAEVTAERAVSTPEYGPAAGDQYSPVVATDNSDFLVAWVDGLHGPAAICMNRVAADGHILDGTGIRIPVAASYVRITGLHFIDGAYTLIYTTGAGTTSPRTAIAIISADGRLIDGPRAILDEEARGRSATNGLRLVLVTGEDVIAIDSRGTVLGRDPAPSPLSTVGSNGTSFLAVGSSQDGGSSSETLVTLDGNGKPVNVLTVDRPAYSYDPFITSDGSDFLVVYTLAFATGATTQRVTAQGSIESTLSTPMYATLVWAGSSYLGLALTADREEVALVTADRSGAPMAEPRILAKNTKHKFNLCSTAWNGSKALLAWMTGWTDQPYALEIVGAFADARGALTSPAFTIPRSANAQRTLAVATSALQDLVAWAEPAGIFATRVTAEGVPLDGRGIGLAGEQSTSTPADLSDPEFDTVRAIDDGTGYLVAWGSNGGWQNDRPINAQRVSYSGVLIGSTIELSPCSHTFDLVMGDAPTLFHTPCSTRSLVAQRVGPAGAEGAPIVISAMPGADFPRAAWSGTQWLVVWNKLIDSGLLIAPPEYRGEVYAARLSSALTILNTQPVAIAVSEFETARNPLVASDGRDFLVVWSSLTFRDPSGIAMRLVHADGSVDDGAPLVAGPVEAKSIVWSGRYAVAYSTYGLSSDLFMTHAGSHDTVVISDGPTDKRDVVLVARPGRPVRAIYARVAPEPPYGGVQRLFMRDEVLARRRSVRSR